MLICFIMEYFDMDYQIQGKDEGPANDPVLSTREPQSVTEIVDYGYVIIIILDWYETYV